MADQVAAAKKDAVADIVVVNTDAVTDIAAAGMNAAVITNVTASKKQNGATRFLFD